MSCSPCLIFHPPSYFTALAWHSTFSLLLGFLNVGTSVVVCGDHLRHPTRWTVPFHCHWAFPSVVVKWSTQWPVNRDVPAKLGLADAPTLLCLAPNWVKTSLLWKIGLHPHRPANTSSCPPGWGSGRWWCVSTPTPRKIETVIIRETTRASETMWETTNTTQLCGSWLENNLLHCNALKFQLFKGYDGWKTSSTPTLSSFQSSSRSTLWCYTPDLVW